MTQLSFLVIHTYLFNQEHWRYFVVLDKQKFLLFSSNLNLVSASVWTLNLTTAFVWTLNLMQKFRTLICYICFSRLIIGKVWKKQGLTYTLLTFFSFSFSYLSNCIIYGFKTLRTIKTLQLQHDYSLLSILLFVSLLL
jgi:hypothetical protein